MSGFYSKMLINIRNLYFNNSDDMKTILHGIFLDAADVFLNGYTPSYCEENELIPTAQKFVEKLIDPSEYCWSVIYEFGLLFDYEDNRCKDCRKGA